jgi:hypothetical protein
MAWEMGTVKRWQVLAPVALVLGVSCVGALAQAPMKAWPEPQQPQAQPQQQRAWPGEAPQQQQVSAPSSAPAPAPMMGPPQMQGPSGFGGGGGMGGPPQPNAAQQACIQDFGRLKNDVEAKGRLAKAVNDRKGSREELCSAITGIHTAQSAWVKWAQDSANKCGLPKEVIGQLKLGQTNLAKMKTNVCSAGPAAVAQTPKLSEALGTDKLPSSSSATTEKKRGGVLDTMTGTAIR